ncbi:hypothetical protein C2R22_17420 [Salinigranum rubrum]|uniref:Uncharacterized protein n=1 Tax=Salinigranum rubrum TaxID=755307 RepID=A0A2I8VMT8_9EURY|nr:hypothetical protein [Salinigranum rubrum]AUV83205.1 hypothetical protein C2R22_17420 [Salinigranum rubrum]
MPLPSILTRRRLLAGVGAVALAGCLGDDNDGSEPATASSTATNPAVTATATTESRSTTAVPSCAVDADLPTTEFGPPYPPLGAVDSPALAVDFALEFEEALQRNRVRILEPAISYVRLDSDESTDVRSVERGFLVGARVELTYGNEVHTSSGTATGFQKRHVATAAYFVGDRALRVGTAELAVVDPRDAADGETVACGE